VPSAPPIAALGEVGCWTTDDALEAERIPASIVILGGGATALEFATYYNSLGAAVTLIQRGPQLLTGSDADAAAALRHAFEARGIRIFSGTRLVSAGVAGGEKIVTFEHNGATITAGGAEILVAAGRTPAVAGLGLEKAGVAMERGRPAMRGTQQTTADHIFAAGDIAGPYEIVHIAIQQGEIAARNAARLLGKLTGPLEEMDYRLKLLAIFTHPQVGTVGLSERECAEQEIPIRTAKYPFADHGKSLVRGEPDGFVKLIVERDSGRIVGGACVGPEASELIHEIVVAMHFRATAADLAAIPHYHPTLSEIWTYPASELA
jgi:pyruvate/2-oxoglutarate dehydrogenase complex dihydrolipoamide dehydrogenase (E3) component